MREWLKGKRDTLGVSQNEVASNCSITRAYYTAIENGTRNPSVKVAMSIASFLGFNWIYFFEEKGNELTRINDNNVS
ncbi:helix-turn-helix domain-containing protein [Latilactobacillus sakei]